MRPRLKWPNDVFLGGRKVCGILVEMKQGPGGAPRLVVGIGLNCQGAPEDFPPEVSGLLTTLAHEAGREVNMEEVFQALLAELEATLGSLTKERLPLLLQAWEEMAAMKGRPLRYPVQEGMRPGKALELTTEGQLLIETAEGAHHIHSSGELEWLD